jgi:hypothetical protein
VVCKRQGVGDESDDGAKRRVKKKREKRAGGRLSCMAADVGRGDVVVRMRALVDSPTALVRKGRASHTHCTNSNRLSTTNRSGSWIRSCKVIPVQKTGI